MSNYKRSKSTFAKADDFFLMQLEANLQRELEKVAVEPYRAEDLTKSVHDQINNIIGNKKPRHTSVAAAVEEMRNRSGLTDYLMKIESNTDDSNKKLASLSVKVFEVAPQVKFTLDNYIHDTRGFMSVPAIIDFIKIIHSSDVSDVNLWRDPALLEYVSQKCESEKSNHADPDSMNRHLGKVNNTSNTDVVDPSNTDALHCLQPATGK
jgi:hypothetical protein